MNTLPHNLHEQLRAQLVDIYDQNVGEAHPAFGGNVNEVSLRAMTGEGLHILRRPADQEVPRASEFLGDIMLQVLPGSSDDQTYEQRDLNYNRQNDSKFRERTLAVTHSLPLDLARATTKQVGDSVVQAQASLAAVHEMDTDLANQEESGLNNQPLDRAGFDRAVQLLKGAVPLPKPEGLDWYALKAARAARRAGWMAQEHFPQA